MGSLNQRNIVVLFGSQTGTAQEVAERIGREGERLHFNMEVTSMDSFDIRQLPTTPLVVYVASTTGMPKLKRLIVHVFTLKINKKT